MKINYDSNNSGGRWWLRDEDWFALEQAGWVVSWFKATKKRLPMDENRDRWLGALATEAEKEFETPGDAMREFEKITGQNVMDNGCNCCGAPHNFSWNTKDGKMEYASGEGCSAYLFGEDAPKSLREALEKKDSWED